ncbi:hypothetical protein SK128_006200, partial [Halocaridina rubra]
MELSVRQLLLVGCVLLLPDVIKLVDTQLKLQTNINKTVVHFQTEGMARPDTFLKYKKNVPLMKRLTVCFRVYLLQVRDEDAILSYALEDEADELFIAFSFEEQALMVACCKEPMWMKLAMPVRIRTWISVCIALDLDDMKYHLASYGDVREGMIPTVKKADYVIRNGGLLILGQDQDVFDGGFNKFQSLRGDLSDLRIYDYVLPSALMTSYAECSIYINVLPMIDLEALESDFELVNVYYEEIPERVICSRNTNFTVILPEFRSFIASELVCHTLGGKLSLPQSNSDKNDLFQTVLPYGKECAEVASDNFWIGAIGNFDTQKWEHYLTKEPLSYTNFLGGGDNAIAENAKCATFIGHNFTMESEQGLWTAQGCFEERCAVCSFKKVAILKVRGLCAESEFDRRFFLSERNGSLSFSGVYYSEIIKNPPVTNEETGITNYGSWTLRRIDKPEMTATMEMESPRHYPIGLNTWIIKNGKCGKSKATLVLTSCEDHQFSCSDGGCISIDYRCDSESTCRDGSDEDGCSYLYVKKNYDITSPPPRLRGVAVKISLHMNIKSIKKIDLPNFNFVCEIEMVLQWIDARVKVQYLNIIDEINVVPQNEYPWVPKLEYSGDENTVSDAVTTKSRMVVLRRSSPLGDNDQIVQESLAFDARKSPLLLKEELTVSTVCLYDLQAFPFDTQTCTI